MAGNQGGAAGRNGVKMIGSETRAASDGDSAAQFRQWDCRRLSLVTLLAAPYTSCNKSKKLEPSIMVTGGFLTLIEMLPLNFIVPIVVFSRIPFP